MIKNTGVANRYRKLIHDIHIYYNYLVMNYYKYHCRYMWK